MRYIGIGIFLILTGSQVFTQDVVEVLQKVFEVHSSIQSVQLDLLMNERMDGKMVKTHNFIKAQVHPERIYMYQQSPVNGLEVLYPSTKENTKALVYPGTFPWKTLQLDPLGYVMRKDFHHSIFKSGYGFIMGVLEHLFEKYSDQIQQMAKIEAIVKYDGILCYKLIVENPHFNWGTYNVDAPVQLETLARQLHLSDYMIKANNPVLSYGKPIEAGTMLNVPSDYGKTFVLYVSKETFLLIGLKVYDDKGLFEEYTYRNVKLNPSFTELDFSSENPAYNF